MRDELSVYFENPATDPMGYDHVEGRLFCTRDRVELQYKRKDRAFRKAEAQAIVFGYGEVDRVQFDSGWFRPSVLLFQSRSPEKLEDFPGAEVGRVELRVQSGSKREAKKAAAFIEYHQSEAYLRESEERLGELGEGL